MSLPNDSSFKLTIDEEKTVLEHPITMGARLEVDTNKLATEFFGKSASSGSLIPPVVRYVSSDFRHFIIERPPSLQKVLYNPGIKSQKNDVLEFKIPLPWMLYGLTLDSTTYDDRVYLEEIYLYARNTQLYSEEEVLGFAPLPNTNNGGGLCFDADDINRMIKQYDKTDYQAIFNTIITAIWNSEFNDDVNTYTWAQYCPEALAKPNDDGDPNALNYQDYPGCKILEAWSNLSEYEALEIAYKPATWGQINPFRVKDLIEHWSKTYDYIGQSNQPFLDYIRNLQLKVANS